MKNYTVELQEHEMNKVWDALYGRMCQSGKAGDQEKVLFYRNLMQEFDTDIVASDRLDPLTSALTALKSQIK